MRRLKLYHLFFLSTLKINVPLSLLACLLISKGDWIIYFDALPYMLGGVGVITSLLYKEVMEKEAYYFYYNSGILKRNLIVFTFIVYWFILWIIRLCVISLR